MVNETEVKSEVETIIDSYIASGEWVTNPNVPRNVKSFMKEDKQGLIEVWNQWLAFECGILRKRDKHALTHFAFESSLDNLEGFHSYLGGFIEGLKEQN